MSRFAETLKSGRFVVTAELSPPKGVDIESTLEAAQSLKAVDAINVTDQQAAVMRLGPIALSRILLERGFEPICQLTCRDRNRIALQSDLLSAYVLGIESFLCLTGDPTTTGDHPDAKPVFDLDVIGLLKAAKSLESGRDLVGNQLKGKPRFCLGAAANPGAPLEREITRMRQKAEAGATFFQTQAIFDVHAFEKFMEHAKPLGIPILAGIIVLKSGNMARYLNRQVPGINVPQSLIEEMDEARDKEGKGVEIAARIIRDVKGLCQGVHIMSIGWEKKVPAILRASGLLV